MVKILNFFIIWPRNFKFWLWKDYGALISYQLKNFGPGPPFSPPGPQKVKILKFLFFNVGPSKFDIILIVEPWFHINWKKNEEKNLGPPIGLPGPPKGKNFEIFVFQERALKILL